MICTMKKPKILLIDDDKLLTDVLGGLLLEKGYMVEVAHTSEEGVEKAALFHPDLILLDIMVPQKNGLDVVKDLCSKEAKMCDKIVIMTSLDDNAYLARAMEYNVTTYVTKNNTTPEAIVALVESKLQG